MSIGMEFIEFLIKNDCRFSIKSKPINNARYIFVDIEFDLSALWKMYDVLNYLKKNDITDADLRIITMTTSPSLSLRVEFER